MNRIWWWLAERVSGLLELDERDAVRGDLQETGMGGWKALGALLGLVARRQVGLWMDWRPWLALLGIVVPLGALLSLVSRRVIHGSAVPIWMYVNNWTMVYLESPGARRELVSIGSEVVTQYLIVICWAWASGLLLGCLSRRTISVSGIFLCLVVLFGHLLEAQLLPGLHPSRAGLGNANAAVFSLTFYRVVLPRTLQALLVLAPAVWGMRQGRRLAALPPPLRAFLWGSAAATVVVFVIRNWGWVQCSNLQACMEWAIHAGYARVNGRSATAPFSQMPALPLALIGPLGYMLATAVWRYCHGKTAESV